MRAQAGEEVRHSESRSEFEIDAIEVRPPRASCGSESETTTLLLGIPLLFLIARAAPPRPAQRRPARRDEGQSFVPGAIVYNNPVRGREPGRERG